MFSSVCSPAMTCLYLHVSVCICWDTGGAEGLTSPFPMCR